MFLDFIDSKLRTREGLAYEIFYKLKAETLTLGFAELTLIMSKKWHVNIRERMIQA